jgi:hypothetical protein
MSVSTTNTSEEYLGDGATTVLPITFEFLTNSQVKVKKLVIATDVETILAEGVDYTLTGGPPATGGDPATDVTMTTAPASGEKITVYRQTALLQNTEFLDTVLADPTEDQLDLIVMMIQELATEVTGGTATASAAPTELALQSVGDAETITVQDDSQKLIKRIQGGTADANTETTIIEDGLTAWQELRLLGQSDTQTLTLQSATNLKLNGDMVFFDNSVLDLVWDNTNLKWIETGRRN